MNFSLKDLELHFGNALIQEASDAMQYAFIDKISNIGNDTWSIRFAADDVSPTCIIKKNMVKKYSCTCAPFNIYKKCKHTAALCILVRKIKIKSELSHDEDYLTSVERNKISSVSKILEKTPAKDLIRFVTIYAKSDPDLSLALKARFMFNLDELVTLNDEVLLTQAVKRLINAKRASENSFYKIIYIIDGYIQQAEDKILLHELIQAKNIYGLLLQNFSVIYAHFPSFGQKIVDRSINSIKKLQLIHSLLVAPTAKSEVMHILLELLNGIEFVHDIDWHRNLRTALIKVSTEQGQILKLQEELVNNVNKKELSIDIRAIYIVFWIQTNLVSSKRKSLPLYDTFEVLDQDTIRAILSDLINQYEMNLAGEIIDIVKDQSEMYSEAFMEEIELVALDIFTRTKDWSKAHKLVLKHFKHNPDLKILQFIAEHFPEKMENLISELDIQSDKYPEHKIKTQAIIYVYQHNYKGLVDLISESRDLELLLDHDKIIWTENDAKARELYLLTTNEYLENYFGEPAQIFIQKVVTHLFQKGHRDFATDLKKILVKKFPGRSLFTFRPTFILG